MKHREDRQKYFAARRIFNSRLASVFHEEREVNKKKRLNRFFLSTRERSGTRLKTESETWGETLSPHRACEARALRARETLTARFTDFFTDFEKKTDCFAVYLISDTCTVL